MKVFLELKIDALFSSLSQELPPKSGQAGFITHDGWPWRIRHPLERSRGALLSIKAPQRAGFCCT